MNPFILHHRFATKNSGVLYEDSTIQIGYKLETRANLARLGMFYGNKTNSSFTDFCPSLFCSGVLSSQLIAQVLFLWLYHGKFSNFGNFCFIIISIAVAVLKKF